MRERRPNSRPEPPLTHLTIAGRLTLCGLKAGGAPPPGNVCARCREVSRDRLRNFQTALGGR